MRNPDIDSNVGVDLVSHIVNCLLIAESRVKHIKSNFNISKLMVIVIKKKNVLF